jgi:hypothetical protein
MRGGSLRRNRFVIAGTRRAPPRAVRLMDGKTGGSFKMKTFVCNFTVAAVLLVVVAVGNVGAQGRPGGSGLVLDSLTGISLPLVGELGDIVVDQAVITDLRLVEDVVGQIIGLEVTGTLTGVLSATGVEIVDEQFTSTVSITSSGPGQCQLIGIDLGPLNLDVLGLVTVDVPEATVTGRGSGAVGSLLCSLGTLLSSAIGVVTQSVQDLVTAINNLI